MSTEKEPDDSQYVESLPDGTYRVTLGCSIKTEDGVVDTLVCHPLNMGHLKKLDKMGDVSEFGTTEYLVSASCGLSPGQYEALTPRANIRLSGAIGKYFL